GDTYVLSAHPIPGNEEAIHRIINRLFQKGANVIYPQLARVHVSGHASQEEQKLLLSLLRPKFFIPIHGELRMLNAHKRLAQSLGIPSSNIFVGENGTPIEFTSTSATQLERMPGGYVFVDGSGVGDIGPVVLKDREALARDGFVLVIVRRDEKGGLRENPEIITRGFVYMKEAEELIKAMSEAAGKELSNITASTSTDAIRSRVGEAAGKFIANETRRRPMLITVVA
ncbi:MAG TPA: ribonuclease J, partial [Thermoflexales bacterium]|nr:ribonuclease J [Thermoflexales bacterium]